MAILNVKLTKPAGSAEELNELLITDASMVRRRKSDVMRPMPDLTENIVSTKLNEEYTDMYKEATVDFYNFYLEKAKELAAEEGIGIERAMKIASKKLDSSAMLIQIASS